MHAPVRLVLAGLAGATLGLSAQADSESEADALAPPMEEATLEDIGVDTDWLYETDTEILRRSLTTSSGNYDTTTLSKFIPGTAFIPLDSTTDGTFDDFFTFSTGGCIIPGNSSGGDLSQGYAPIELPGNALLTSAIFYLRDNDAAHDITVSLRQTGMGYSSFLTPPPDLDLVTTWDRDEDVTLADGSTSGTPDWTASVLNVDPDVVTGNVPGGGFLLSGTIRFFSAFVEMRNTAGSNHQLCGVRVTYQVPTSGMNQAFTPIEPCRILDSRPANGGTGIFAANETRTIRVTANTTPQGGEGACGIPTTATAVETNITVVNPVDNGALKLWAPSDSEPRALLAYAPGVAFWNGAATVPISTATDLSGKGMNVKTNFNGAHVVLGVTGYYSPVSNMGN